MARKASPWLVETKDKGDGKVYKVYVFDNDGNRIPADTPADKVAEIRAKPKEKKVREPKVGKEPSAKRKAEKPLTVGAVRKRMRKELKRLVPLYIQEKWFQMMKSGHHIAGQEDDKTDSYMVLRHVGNWLLIHMQKKNTEKWFYYNPVSQKTIAFVKELHKPGSGDESILWPNENGDVVLKETEVVGVDMRTEVERAIEDEAMLLK